MNTRKILTGVALAALLAGAALAQQADPHHPAQEQAGQAETGQTETGKGTSQIQKKDQAAPDRGMMGQGMMGMMGQMMGQGGMMGMMGQGGMQGGSAMSGMMHDMSQMMARMSEMMKMMEAGGMAQSMTMGQPKGDQGPASQAFAKANADMHAAMAIEYSGDADVDFARGMIPHHQGAIDMAKVVLEHGKDPELRKLAEEIVAAQEKEIAFMKEWLAKKGQ
jgi:uncharacterized protein (DUF305 family)